MSLAEIEREVLLLGVTERAHLASSILRSLPVDDDTSDEEAFRRAEELDRGEVQAISYQELNRRLDADELNES